MSYPGSQDMSLDLGSNSRTSKDSRFWGSLKRSKVLCWEKNVEKLMNIKRYTVY